MSHRKKKYPIIRPWKITPKEEAMFRATDPTFEWMTRLTGKQLQPYVGKWVAAQNCRFIAVADTYAELLDELGDTDLETVIIQHYSLPWTILR